MIAFDRDGTVIGKLGNFEANHPKHLTCPEDQKIIVPIAEYINEHGGVLISNQQGIQRGYTTLERVIAEFLWLHQQIPGIAASFFCPDAGESCWMVWKSNALCISDKAHYANLKGTYRKPQAGMFRIAADQFGTLHQFSPLQGYVGDLSGNPEYGNGLDSDKQAARNAGIPYWDVNEFIRLIERGK